MRSVALADLLAVVDVPAEANRSGDLASYIAAGVAREPSKPFLTWYDDRTGERVELSYATFANWVWKTANYLRDGLDVQPGDEVAVLLPTHWQTAVIWYAAWAAGAVVSPMTELPAGAGAAAVFAHEPDLPSVVAAAAGRSEVVGLSLRPMAAKLSAKTSGCEDFAVAVPVHGDRFAPTARLPLSAPALPGRSGAQVLAGAAAAASHLGLSRSDRLLVTVDITGAAAFIATVAAAFDAGAGVVLSPYSDPLWLPRRCADERVTTGVTG